MEQDTRTQLAVYSLLMCFDAPALARLWHTADGTIICSKCLVWHYVSTGRHLINVQVEQGVVLRPFTAGRTAPTPDRIATAAGCVALGAYKQRV